MTLYPPPRCLYCHSLCHEMTFCHSISYWTCVNCMGHPQFYFNLNNRTYLPAHISQKNLIAIYAPTIFFSHSLAQYKDFSLAYHLTSKKTLLLKNTSERYLSFTLFEGKVVYSTHVNISSPFQAQQILQKLTKLIPLL